MACEKSDGPCDECGETCQDIVDEKAAVHERLKGDALEAVRHAELTAHIYACNCEIGLSESVLFRYSRISGLPQGFHYNLSLQTTAS